MRLGRVTIGILLVVLVLIVLMPATFLQATVTVIPAQYQNMIPEDLMQNMGTVLAEFSVMTARPMTAVSVYDFFINKHPDKADFYRLKSEALISAGDDAGALQALDQAISLDPSNPLLLTKKARLLIKIGKSSEAEAVFSKILQIQTDKPQYLSVIADIALEKARYLDAYDRYSILVNLTPTDARNWEKRSDVIFALLTIPTAGANASVSLKQADLYTPGIKGYEQAVILDPGRGDGIKTKIEKRSDEYVARTIQELEDRYREFRYLQPGEKPLGP
nr:tetratricopeptide repeat protein [uncultured Methanospirillum sp.]